MAQGRIGNAIFQKISSPSRNRFFATVPASPAPVPVPSAAPAALKPNLSTQTTVVSVVTSALNKSQGGLAEPKVKLQEKFRIFWKNLLTDYKDVFVETYQESKNKPKKTAIYLSLLGGLGYCMATNPEYKTYKYEVTKYDSEMSILSKDIRNPDSEKYLQSIRKMQMKDVLRSQSLGICTLIWRDNENSEAGVYYSTCKYIKPRFSEIITERVVDIGFIGKWWSLEKNMQDFDVNPNEWPSEESSVSFSLIPKVFAQENNN